MILISVTLAVAAIPEGIPLCVTISLPLWLPSDSFGGGGQWKCVGQALLGCGSSRQAKVHRLFCCLLA